jgi:hypothetical protein
MKLQILLSLNITTSGFSNMTPCNLVHRHQRFEGSCYFHINYRIDYPEDGGRKFLQNVGTHLQNKRGHIPEDCNDGQVFVFAENKGEKAEDEK